MNWGALEGRTLAPLPERGRPARRLTRGVLWAILLLFVISILVFCIGIFGPKDFFTLPFLP